MSGEKIKNYIKTEQTSEQPKTLTKEQIKRQKARETLAKINALRDTEERELLAKLEREARTIDELISQTGDEQKKKTLIGLRRVIEDAKRNPTTAEKILKDMKDRTNRKPY